MCSGREKAVPSVLLPPAHTMTLASQTAYSVFKCSALIGWKSRHLLDELICRECHFV